MTFDVADVLALAYVERAGRASQRVTMVATAAMLMMNSVIGMRSWHPAASVEVATGGHAR
ncbi:MAG TPA: hypothetical protein VF257_13680 [Solirubrobacteraceae bacterium]